MNMKIKDIEFPGRAFLAPMAGVADRAFREVCASFGAAYTVTEMVSAKGLSMGDKKAPLCLPSAKKRALRARRFSAMTLPLWLWPRLNAWNINPI